jgi:transcriptional regulator with XRE-family HTH domain
VALIACRSDLEPATGPIMQGERWQIRAKAAKLTQRSLARLTGKSENTISRQLRGEFGEVPGYLIAIIIAWEGMDDDQRADWITSVETERRKA